MSYYQDLSEDDKMKLRLEFDTRTTTRERRIELLTLLRDGADEAQMGRPCLSCKHYPFFAPHPEALIEGHVYSQAGIDELQISGFCEFCFDKVTAEPEEDEDAWKQRAIAEDMEFMAQSMGPDTEVRRLSADEVRKMFGNREGDE